MPLLDRLSQTDWSALHHAYGPADDVPGLLRALVDPREAPVALRSEAERSGRGLREHVEWVLWGNVFHQGTRWQVTPHVVPFLVEILRDGPDDDGLRRFLIPYLHHLAVGYPEDVFPSPVDPREAFRELEGMKDPGGEPDYENELLFGIWARDSYLAVEEALGTITPFVHARDEETAVEAIALTASFPRRADLALPLLRDVARTRRDRRAAHAALSIARLAGADALEDAERLVGAEDRAVAIQAACAAVLADPARASGQAIALLTAPLGDAAEARSAHAGSLTRLVGRCLARLPEEHRERALDAIAQQHRDARPFERVSLAASLLDLAFPERRAPASAAALTAPQRRALEAIRDRGAFLVDGAHFANYGLLLREWGLPDSARELGDWLAGREPTERSGTRRPWWKSWRSPRG